ncbi:MAG: peptide chain release factor N(5)-glutamine methyltransferase [Clostridiales bacterium]|nr:peptide chain release factor N(5)-glutamine methyltransferase [Clostridiales bacterium]
MPNISDALAYGRTMLSEQGIGTAGLDSALLLIRVAGLSKTDLATKTQRLLSEAEYRAYDEMLRRRAAFEPVQYILNACEFMSLPFYVDERVLIPRADTETLAEAVIGYVYLRCRGELRSSALSPARENINILDLCCGSGALAVSLAHYIPKTRVTASDIDAGVLQVAGINAERNGVSERINLVESDLFASIPRGRLFDIIVSNPPYVRSGDIPGLEPGVKDYEPRLALDGGADGLRFLDIIIRDSRGYLRPGGGLFLEIGHDQGADVKTMLEQAGYMNVKVLKDLAGKDRVLQGEMMSVT